LTLQFGLSQQNSQLPLSEEEKRRIILQLYELQSCRKQVFSYEDYIKLDKEQDDRERTSLQRSIDVEKRATAVTEKERDLEKERAEFYKKAFEEVTKKRGFGCTMKKIFTLGIARCR
jgi:hypothetical protein